MKELITPLELGSDGDLSNVAYMHAAFAAVARHYGIATEPVIERCRADGEGETTWSTVLGSVDRSGTDVNKLPPSILNIIDLSSTVAAIVHNEEHIDEALKEVAGSKRELAELRRTRRILDQHWPLIEAEVVRLMSGYM